jgi:DNA polymerase III subunit epsilon
MSDTSRARRSAASANKTTPDVDDQTQVESAGADVVDEVSDATAIEATGSSSALLRKAHDHLAERGEPIAIGELARVVFGLGKLPEQALATWMSMLTRMLGASPLFVADDDQHMWRLAAWDLSQRSLLDVEFVVIDVETTGLAPGRHRVIEVAAVIVHGYEIGAQFRSLINPGRRIPQFITSFTGISEGMTRRAPAAEVALPKLDAFIGGRPIVGHNVGFDLGFLAYEAERCHLATNFPDTGIDTIALARRYLTGMRRARLDRLAAALHLPVGTRHRALPDAMLTAQIFALLLARAREDGCVTLEDLWRVQDGVAPQRTSMPPVRPTGNLYLNPAWRQDFPMKPGVYLMRDVAGEVIYVGKAKRLRDRLASYYSQPLGYTRKMDGLLQSVRSIETRVLGSELEALIVESRLIKELQPRYNVQLRNHERYPFIKLDVQHPYPRFYATREVSADGARYFGPFRSSGVVNAALEVIQKTFPVRTCTRSLPPNAPPSEPCLRYHLKRCPAPCRGELSAETAATYMRDIEEACKFLGGERDDLMDRLRKEMLAASARQDYERAARLRDALRDADAVLLGQRLITGAVEANNLLILYPSSEDGAIEAYLIRHGRLAGQRRSPANADDLTRDLGELVTLAQTLPTPPLRVGREEVDQINIIARWIHQHSDDEARAFFSLPRELDDTEIMGAFINAVIEAVLSAQTVESEAEESDVMEQVKEAEDGILRRRPQQI